MTEARDPGGMMVAGVVGQPIAHSLSPRLHAHWIDEARLQAAYVPFAVASGRFNAFIEGLRGGAVRGVNVTLPFKIEALGTADKAAARARDAGSANLLLFHPDGTIEADNTDGEGLLYGFRRQAPGHDLRRSPVVILGAGGAARGAAAALRAHGVQDLRFVNRTLATAQALAEEFAGLAFPLAQAPAAFAACGTLINTTSAELDGRPVVDLAASPPPPDAVVMDMLYRPLTTQFLSTAKAMRLKTVDGLDMLIGQAIPSFKAFFGVEPPKAHAARSLLLAALGERL